MHETTVHHTSFGITSQQSVSGGDVCIARAEQANNINDCQSANAFFHKFSEVWNHANGKEGQHEEYNAKRIDGAGNTYSADEVADG